MRIIPKRDVRDGTDRNPLGLPASPDHKSVPAVDGPSGAGRTRAERNEWIVSAYLAGLTLEAIGQQYGITRERVRQIVRKRVPAAPGLRRMERMGVAYQRSRQSENRELKEYVCRTCWHPFATYRRAYHHSCSSHCYRLWSKVRRAFDPGEAVRDRIAKARYALSHPDKVNAAYLRWARRVAEGQITIKPYRGRSDSANYAAVEEVLRLRRGYPPPPEVDLMERSA